MRQIDTLRRAGRTLSQSKIRTILTSSAIAIGAFAIITSLALGNGTRGYIASLIGTNINERSMQVTKESQMSFSPGSMGGIKEYDGTRSQYGQAMFDQADIDKIKKIDGVDEAVAFSMPALKYMTIEGNSKKWTTTLNTYDKLIENQVAAGKLPPKGTDISKNDIILPESYAEKLGMKKNEIVGKKVIAYFEVPMTEENLAANGISLEDMMDAEKAKSVAENLSKKYEFTVIALSKKTALSMSADYAAINQDFSNEINNAITKGTSSYGKYMGAIVTVAENKKPADVKEAIKSKTGFSAMTAQDLQEMMFQMVNILQAVVIAFGALALLVSIFGIINTMYVSVLERINQIGLMKALGMRNGEVARMFRYEAAWIGFIGSVIGIALSWIIGNLANPAISEALKIGDSGVNLLKYDIFQAIGLTILLVIIAILASLLPARKAAKLNPIDALRTE